MNKSVRIAAVLGLLASLGASLFCAGGTEQKSVAELLVGAKQAVDEFARNLNSDEVDKHEVSKIVRGVCEALLKEQLNSPLARQVAETRDGFLGKENDGCFESGSSDPKALNVALARAALFFASAAKFREDEAAELKALFGEEIMTAATVAELEPAVAVEKETGKLKAKDSAADAAEEEGRFETGKQDSENEDTENETPDVGDNTPLATPADNTAKKLTGGDTGTSEADDGYWAQGKEMVTNNPWTTGAAVTAGAVLLAGGVAACTSKGQAFYQRLWGKLTGAKQQPAAQAA